MDATLERKALSARVVMIYIPLDENKIPEILLVREKPEKSHGAKHVRTAPGGGYDPNEDNGNVKITGEREFFEETGIKLGPDVLDEDLSHRFPGKSLPRFASHEVHVFLVVTRHKSTPSPQDEDIIAAKWFRLSRLPSEAFPEDGAPLASSSWVQLRTLFRNKRCQQLLDGAGVGEKRINGILKSWKKRRRRQPKPA